MNVCSRHSSGTKSMSSLCAPAKSLCPSHTFRGNVTEPRKRRKSKSFGSSRSQDQQNFIVLAGQSDSEISESKREPEDVRGAIAVGLSLYEEGKYQEALEIFERGLELPGSGMKRFRDKPRAISDGEKQSILYNVACCYSRLEDARTGLVALAGCLESGYEDTDQLKRDPDLEYLRKDSRFNGLLERFRLNAKKGFFDDFLKGFNL